MFRMCIVTGVVMKHCSCCWLVTKHQGMKVGPAVPKK
jgi:hypothetical protein